MATKGMPNKSAAQPCAPFGVSAVLKVVILLLLRLGLESYRPRVPGTSYQVSITLQPLQSSFQQGARN